VETSMLPGQGEKCPIDREHLGEVGKFEEGV